MFDLNLDKLMTIEQVETFRKEVNEACDKRAAKISLCKEVSLLSKKSFPYIKECFEAISPLLYKTTKGKKILSSYMSEVRKNKNLSKLHKLSENIRKAGVDMDVEYFIDSLKDGYDVDGNTLTEDTERIGRILAEGMLLLGNDALSVIPEENVSLNNAIIRIAESKSGAINTVDYAVALKVIRENIGSSKSIVSERKSKPFDIDVWASTMINNFNNKYKDVLTSEEIQALREISNSEEKPKIFENYKSACIEKLNESIKEMRSSGDEESASKLTEVLNQVNNKKYSAETAGEDICNLLELSKMLR